MTFDVDDVLAQLSLEEKAGLLSGRDFWHTQGVDRLGVRSVMVSDGPHGLRAQPERSQGGDHVGLGGSLPATCFPTAGAIASTWNPALLHEIGEALATEARACNLSVILGPGVNMKRSPLCGRNFEYFSEDPYLAGELAVGIISGIQSQGDVGTSIKHYAANNQETDRLRVDARVSERALREIYLPAFERAVTGCQPWTVMCCYNKVNGISGSAHTWLLQTVLRDEWGFQGLVVSDWGAVYDRVAAARAGLDLEMPPDLPRSPRAIAAAVRSGDLDAASLDARARAVLELNRKGAAVLDADTTFDADAHHALARRAAGEAIVLLANDAAAGASTPLLPLRPEARLAVIGEFARTPRFQGAGSSQVNPTRVDVFLDELRAVVPSVTFAPGYGIGTTHDDDRLRSEALELAAAAEVCVVVIGLPAADESEGFDRTHLRLPANQLALLRAVAEVNPTVVTVLVNGSTIELGDVLPHSTALVEAWLTGQAAGGALADVLTGAVNPSGRLAETFPHRLEDNPSFLNFPGDSEIVVYGEGIYIGYRAYDKQALDVAFPFGYGLSYTTFDLSGLAVALSGSVEAGDLAADVTVTVTNTGDREGAEVVQVYVGDVACSAHRPVRELKGFTKVRLAPGEARTVTVRLDQRAFSFWSDTHHRWVVEAGDFVVEVGRNSRDLPLSETVAVAAPSLQRPLTDRSSAQEWWADPVGREIVEAMAAAGEPTIASDPVRLAVVGNFPMRTLSAFGGMSASHEALDAAVAEYERRTGRA